MFGFTSTITVALLAVSAVSGAAIPRGTTTTTATASTDTKLPPAGWVTDIMEPYDQYNTRYLALDCEAKHNTTFFSQCCHPMKAWQTLATARPPQCIPTAAQSSSAAAAEPTSTVTAPAPSSSDGLDNTDDNDDGDCDCDDDDDDCGDDDGDDGDDGDDDGDCDEPESSSFSPSSTHVVASTSVVKSTPISTSVPTSSSAAAAPINVAPSPPIAPVATSSPVVDPKPTSTPKPTTSSKKTESTSTKTTSAAAPTSTNEVETGGFATFFYQGGVAGACGVVHSDSDFIAAMDSARYGDSGNASPLCGKTVRITNTQNNKSVTVAVADDCPTCDNENSIDLSVAAFNSIADEATGIVPITWFFED